MTVQECIDFNRQHFFENYGENSEDYEHFIVARDRQQHKVLIGGIGAVGVGQVWYDDSSDEKSMLPGWEYAPDTVYRGIDNNVDENMEREFDMIRQRNRWLISQN